MRLQGWLPIALVAVALTGCGGDDEGEGGAPEAAAGADPAQAIPADAPVYLEAVVRPEGEQGENVQALLDRFLGDRSLTELLDEQLTEEGKTYAEDIEPWLGGRAGVGVFDLAADEPSFIVAVSVTDAEAAEAAIAGTDDTRKGPMAGDVQTYLSDDDAVGAVTEDYLLVSETQEGLQSALDTIGGDSLADAERFTSAVGDLPSERLGAVYLDLAAVKDLAAQDPTLDPAGKQVIDQLLGEGEPVTGALIAEEDALRGEFRVSSSAFGPLGSLVSAEAPELIAELPAESWVAVGYRDVGQTVETLIDEFAGAIGGAAITGQLEQQIGIDLDRDVFSWVGDLGVFVRGDTMASLEGGVVIEATDEDAAKAAIPRLVEGLRSSGAPVSEAELEGAELAFTTPSPGTSGPLVVAYGNGRAVIAIGEDAAKEGLEASEKLGDTEAYERGKDAIDGVAPSFFINYEGIVALAESAGTIDDPDYEKVRPYLEQLDVIVGGAEEDGDDLRSLFAVKAK